MASLAAWVSRPASALWIPNSGRVRLIDRVQVPDAAVRTPGTTQDLRQCAPGQTVSLVPLPGQSACADWSPYYLDASGERNVYSPELQYSATLFYDFVTGSGGTWTPRVNYSYTDDQDINVIRREDFWLIPERDILNVSLTYAKDTWLAQLYANNATDETYIAAIGTGGGLDNNSVVYGNPLNYGLRFRYGF